MDVSMMSHMKVPEEQDRCLKNAYLDEKLKAEIVAEALEKACWGHLAKRCDCLVLVGGADR
jgi:primosomal protein N''